jgi:hypothetical protein
MASKEDTMIRRLLSLSPANLLHQVGTGRALENACRERDELARTMEAVDALAGRLEPGRREPVLVPANAVERVAA